MKKFFIFILIFFLASCNLFKVKEEIKTENIVWTSSVNSWETEIFSWKIENNSGNIETLTWKVDEKNISSNTWKIEEKKEIKKDEKINETLKDLEKNKNFSWFYEKNHIRWWFDDEAETKFSDKKIVLEKNKENISKLDLETSKKIYCKYKENCDFEKFTKEEKENKTYLYYKDNETEKNIVFDKNKNIFIENQDEVMSNEKFFIKNIDWYYFYKDSICGCGSCGYTQKFLNKNLEEINYIPNISSFKIGEIEYYPIVSFIELRDSLVFENKWSFYKQIWEESVEMTFSNSEEVKNEIIKEMESWKVLKQNYFVKFKKYPDLLVYFKSKNYPNQAEQVLFLDKNINLDKSGNLMDFELTNKFFAYKESSKIFMKESEKEYDLRITEFKKEDLPLFKLKKIENLEKNGKNFYLLYASNWYKIEQTAELCKPLVYYYSKNPVKNSLTLNLKSNDYFTTLIPEFNAKNTWDFMAKNGKINVKNEKFDYLYYSIVNVWYTHNENWWIVKWDDIVEFFEDKLAKINFLPSEKKDFIDHWKELYKKEKYYFVSFKYNDELDKIIKLNFKNEPNKIFRVLLDSYELEHFTVNHKKFLYDKKDKQKFDKYLIKRFERWNSAEEVFEWWWVLQTLEKRYVK